MQRSIHDEFVAEFVKQVMEANLSENSFLTDNVQITFNVTFTFDGHF